MQKSDSIIPTSYSSRPILCFDASLIGPWVCQEVGGSWFTERATAIGQTIDGRLNAGVLYEDWNGVNVVCHIRAEGNWANRLFLSTIFDYPFKQLGVKRITVAIHDDNEKSINLVKKMGFALESRLEQANPRGGDILVFRMFRDECKYLRGKYASSA